MNVIDKLLDNGEKFATRSVLRGGAGVGKSCVMLNAVYKARERGWLVLYISRAKELTNSQKSMIAFVKVFFIEQMSVSKELLKTIADRDIEARNALEILEDFYKTLPQKIADIIAIFERYVDAFRLIRCIPILIAIDQWNPFIERSTNLPYNNSIGKLFGTFSEFKMSRGVYLIAVSSSLVKMHFSDGDQVSTISLGALTDEQLRALVQDIVKLHSLEIDLTPEFFDVVKKATGGIVRLVAWLFSVWNLKRWQPATVTSRTDLVPKNVMNKFNSESTSYYRARVTSLLNRSQERLNDYQCAAWLMSGGRIPLESSDGFQEVGLLDENHQVLCCQARNAILTELRNQSKDAIKILASIPGSRWVAHELAFWATFSPRGACIRVPVNGPTGKFAMEVDLHFSRARYQVKIPSNLEDIGTNLLSKGDFLILAPGHATLDFVGFTVDGLLVLGQVSMEKYTGTGGHAHSKLFERKKFGTRDYHIVDFYLQCVGLPRLERADKLPDHVIHLYVTTSGSYLQADSPRNDPVFVIDRKVLEKYFRYPEELLK
ncbi:hypothetical protein BC936DRAFT_143822 [Jimgerdemannia flammicorona]|uniref:Small ribosomal subunit protein mS29 n=1 Tax=Jimgerdemannia flammicorona TaxID=994334 RepID=A0A433DDB9_9FUNG|nr:hypothetical protein BC936DRAFT_143822 [Jimgerdemannia flammicorona]